MPVIKVSMIKGRAAETKKKIAAEITETMHRHTGSEPEHIYVIFEDVEPENWAWKGDLLANQQTK